MGDGDSNKSGRLWCWGRSGCFAVEDSYVGPVDGKGTLGIAGGNRAVMKKILRENGLELGFIWATKLAIQFMGSIGRLDFSSREKILLVCGGGQHGVGHSAAVGGMRCIDIETRGVFHKFHTLPSRRWTRRAGS